MMKCNNKSNIEKLTDIVNECEDPHRILSALALVLKPSSKQLNDASEERKISVREILTLLDNAKI